jgi:hypothetical protein
MGRTDPPLPVGGVEMTPGAGVGVGVVSDGVSDAAIAWRLPELSW